jgi:hypothetical protein
MNNSNDVETTVTQEFDENMVESSNATVVAGEKTVPKIEKKKVSEMTLEELQHEMEQLNKIKEDLKFVTPTTAEQYKHLKTFLHKKAKWEGINAFAVYNLGSEIDKMHDATAKTFTFSHDQLEAIRFLLQKFGSEGLEDARMFVSIMRLINIPLQEASALAMHESEVSNFLQAKLQGIDVDETVLNMTDTMKESVNLPEIPSEN